MPDQNSLKTSLVLTQIMNLVTTIVSQISALYFRVYSILELNRTATILATPLQHNDKATVFFSLDQTNMNML